MNKKNKILQWCEKHIIDPQVLMALVGGWAALALGQTVWIIISLAFVIIVFTIAARPKPKMKQSKAGRATPRNSR